MDAVLQNFRRSFAPSTSFFHSPSLDSPAIMEELYRRADRYSTLEYNIRAATQAVMIISKPIGSNKPEGKKSYELREKIGSNLEISHKKKSPYMVAVLLAPKKAQIWLLSYWRLKKIIYGCHPAGTLKSPYMVDVLLASKKAQIWLLLYWHLKKFKYG